MMKLQTSLKEFRVWEKANYDWLDLKDLDVRWNLDNQGLEYFNHYADDEVNHGWVILKPDEYIMVQYTGLKDREGNKIFEGDFVKSMDCGDGPFLISYDLELCAFLLKSKGVYSFGIRGESDQYEIIGNIFENPELLEGK